MFAYQCLKTFKKDDAMQETQHVRALFEQAKDNYHALKSKIESQAVRWFWASDCLFDLAPFYFEQHRFPRGKILKEAPDNPKNKCYYGVDSDENIIVERRYIELENLYYDTFYFRNENEIIVYHFDYGKDKKLINTKQYVYENERLVAIYSEFYIDTGGWVERFYYQDDKLIKKHWVGKDYYGKEFDRTQEYSYDEIGLLDSIQENGYLFYKKPDKKLSYKKLTEITKNKLLLLLKEHIKNHAPKEQIYCINLSYFEENSIPPAIGFGTQSEREYWLKKDNPYHYSIIWNVADYTYQIEPDCDDETIKLFDLFNQETELKGKYHLLAKMVVECAKQIKQDLAEFELNISDDFVVVASYYDLRDLKSNFKNINPELFEQYKHQLV